HTEVLDDGVNLTELSIGDVQSRREAEGEGDIARYLVRSGDGLLHMVVRGLEVLTVGGAMELDAAGDSLEFGADGRTNGDVLLLQHAERCHGEVDVAGARGLVGGDLQGHCAYRRDGEV